MLSCQSLTKKSTLKNIYIKCDVGSKSGKDKCLFKLQMMKHFQFFTFFIINTRQCQPNAIHSFGHGQWAKQNTFQTTSTDQQALECYINNTRSGETFELVQNDQRKLETLNIHHTRVECGFSALLLDFAVLFYVSTLHAHTFAVSLPSPVSRFPFIFRREFSFFFAHLSFSFSSCSMKIFN